MPIFRFDSTQIIDANVSEIWDFMTAPANLKHITPSHMGFEIVTPNLANKIYPGMMIEYRVKPIFGIPMNWLTEITHVKENEFFVDEQRSGPYTLWHHEHHIKGIMEGVLMTDIVHYIPPLGIIGSLANSLIIRQQLNKIFEFRSQAINNKFPPK